MRPAARDDCRVGVAQPRGFSLLVATKCTNCDRQFGVPLLPDGRRTRTLYLGGVLAYDLPEYASSIKIKALRTVIAENNVNSWGVAATWIRKFH